MLKKSVVLILLVLSTIGCKEVETVDVVPDWLHDSIEIYKSDCAFYGSVATRYLWDTIYIYELTIPISACDSCDFIDANGKYVVFDSASLSSFYNERTNATVIWSFKDEDCLR
jgi:hypothetical protein